MRIYYYLCDNCGEKYNEVFMNKPCGNCGSTVFLIKYAKPSLSQEDSVLVDEV